MKRPLAILTALSLSLSCWSAETRLLECPVSLTNPDGQALDLERCDVRTAVHGPLALVEMEMTFRNPQPRQMEGRFLYLLPPGATVSRFAKEVDGKLMEGEVVEGYIPPEKGLQQFLRARHCLGVTNLEAALPRRRELLCRRPDGRLARRGRDPATRRRRSGRTPADRPVLPRGRRRRHAASGGGGGAVSRCRTVYTSELKDPTHLPVRIDGW